jgi:4-amino-4-deoxy-L-arabinose transferase-like glycosyltransferase
MKRLIALLLLGIVLLGFIARFYRFDNPIADWHSWRQADTGAVTRNFVKEGYSPLYPKYDSLITQNEMRIPNPNRYFFAEFPLYNSMQYFGYILIGKLTLEEWGRLISIIFSTLTIPVLFLLVRKHSNERVALIASFFFAFLPYNIYYGRVIMPDPLHVFLSVLALYLVTLWTRSGKLGWAILAGLAYSGALLTKPYALVLLIPIGYLVFDQWKLTAIKKLSAYVFGIASIVPLLLWRIHITTHPEGMFATSWLYNQGNIRFTGAYFRWLIYDRMNRLIFATGGFVLFFLGIIRGYLDRRNWFYYSWLLAIIVFFIVIAKGNVTHDYYQMPIVPIGSIFIALGLDYLVFSSENVKHRIINSVIGLFLVCLTLAFGWYEVRGYFNINNPAIVEAGKYVDQNLPKDALVIAPYQYDSSFLYQTNRYGWPVGGDLIGGFIKEGANYLVSTSLDDDTRMWMGKCTVTYQSSQFVVVDLRDCR